MQRKTILIIIIFLLCGLVQHSYGQGTLGTPMLLSPKSGSTIDSNYPLFSWTTVGTDVTYQFRLVQVHPHQTGISAMLSNPTYYEVNDLKVSMYQYPFTARALETGKRYAWQVTAIGGEGRNRTYSEIWEIKQSTEIKDSTVHKKKSRPYVYGQLRTKTSGGSILVSNDTLPFRFVKRYSGEALPKIRIRCSGGDVYPVDGRAIKSGSLKIGTNYFLLDVAWLSSDERYLLEVEDVKGMKGYLWFRKS